MLKFRYIELSQAFISQGPQLLYSRIRITARDPPISIIIFTENTAIKQRPQTIELIKRFQKDFYTVN